MTLASGQKILASDYNQLVNDLNEIYAIGSGDKGYGATPLPTVTTPPPFTSSSLLTSAQWTNLRDSIALVGNHQGGLPLLPNDSDLEPGDMVTAFNTFTTAISQTTFNRHNVGSSSTTVNNSVLSSTRTADWSNQIKHVFTVDFGSDDAARFFFNTGGQIRITMSAPNTLAAHNWGGIYSTAGTFIFDRLSYYGLSSTINNNVNLTFFTAGASVYYALGSGSNAWTISSRFIAGTSNNGARGSKIEISSISTDVYSGNPAFPGSPDIVSGTFISTIGERRSVTFFNRPQPIYATVVSLADGV